MPTTKTPNRFRTIILSALVLALLATAQTLPARAAVAANLGILAVFKYFDFFVETANDAALGLSGGFPMPG
ncbi:MAG: hypothetical protein ACFCUS_01145 [Rubrimonas sp.]